MAKKRRKRMDDPGNWGDGRERGDARGAAADDGAPALGEPSSSSGTPPTGPSPDETFEGWVDMAPRDSSGAGGGVPHGEEPQRPQQGWLADVPPGFVVPPDPEPDPEPEALGGRHGRRSAGYSGDPAAGERPPRAEVPRSGAPAGPSVGDVTPPPPSQRRRVGASGRLERPPRRRAVDETLVAAAPGTSRAAVPPPGAHEGSAPPVDRRAATSPPDGHRPTAVYGAEGPAGKERSSARPDDGAHRREHSSARPDDGGERAGGADGGSGGPPRRAYRRHGHFADGPDGRRLEPAGKVLLALLIGLALAALLNAQSLQTQAEAMEIGPARSLMLGLVKPVVAVSSLLHLDDPRSAIETAMGRGDREQANVHQRDVKDTTPQAEIFTPTPERKLAIWVGGDSMAMVFGQSLVAMADKTGVIDTALDYHISSGLSRPDFFDWPERLRTEMESFQPDVPVALFGANDAQDVKYDGKTLYFPSEEWLALYHERVGEAMDILSGEQQRPVWWVGMPITRLSDYNKRIRILNKVYKEEAAKRDNVTFVDTYAMFSDADGTYTDYLPALNGKTERVRQEDGIHWSRAGGDMVAADVLEQISKLYKFPFSP